MAGLANDIGLRCLLHDLHVEKYYWSFKSIMKNISNK